MSLLTIISWQLLDGALFEKTNLNPTGLNPSNREARKDVPWENTDFGETNRNKINNFIFCLYINIYNTALNGKFTTEPIYSDLCFVLTSHYTSYTLTVSIMYHQIFWGEFIWECKMFCENR